MQELKSSQLSSSVGDLLGVSTLTLLKIDKENGFYLTSIFPFRSASRTPGNIKHREFCKNS